MIDTQPHVRGEGRKWARRERGEGDGGWGDGGGGRDDVHCDSYILGG